MKKTNLKSINFVDLTRLELPLKKSIWSGMKSVTNKGDFILGESVEVFEKSFAKYCKTKYAIGVASGSDAILLALRALNIGPGDEVIVPANTFISSVLPIQQVGAKPVLVDIDEKTYLIDTKLIKKAITKKTKAIIPVHLYGLPADLDEINKLAKKYSLFVIEDACQAHGSFYKKQIIGGLSDIACFSFYPGKNLGAFGDGGAVTTNNKAVAEKIRILRNIGQSEKYYHTDKGYNSRLDTLQAVVLYKKLSYLNKWNKQRIAKAKLFTTLLNRLNKDIITPHIPYDVVSNFHLYVIRVKKRDDLITYLKFRKIFTGIHYPVPVHLQECMKDLKYKKGNFPITEKYAKEILSLPLFPQITMREIRRVVSEIKKFYEVN